MDFQKIKENNGYRFGSSAAADARKSTGNEPENAHREPQLPQQMNHDPLTRLPNRNLIYELLERAIARAERSRQLVAVLFLNVDGFSKVNRTVGQYGGDLILCRIAAHLKSSVRKSDAVGRYGGDEFIVIAEALNARDDVFPVLRTLMASLKQPVGARRGSVQLEFSIGISLCPTNGRDAATLIREADEAMYQVKSNGRNGHRFYARHA